MLKAEFRDAQLFKDYLEAVHVITDEMCLEISENGIKTRIMDPARVAMVRAEFPKEIFEEFEYTGEPTKIVVGLAAFLTKEGALRKVRKDDALLLRFDDKHVFITLKGKLSRNWKKPLLDTEDLEEVPEPKIDYGPMRTVIVTEALKEVFEDANDNYPIIVKSTPTTIEFSQTTDDGGDFNVTFKKGSDSLLTIEGTEDTRTTFSLDYLREIFKKLPKVCDIVEMQLKTDMPIKIRARCKDPTKLVFHLAPRIEVD